MCVHNVLQRRLPLAGGRQSTKNKKGPLKQKTFGPASCVKLLMGAEDEETFDGDASSFSTILLEDMLHHFGMVEEFVADGNDRDRLAYVHKIPDLHS